MSAGPTVRPAVGSDADALAFIRHTTWVETYAALVAPEFWTRFTLESNRASWREWLARGIPARVAEIDGSPVGFAAAGDAMPWGGHAPVRTLQLFMLYVLAEHHGTGAGQQLLDAVIPPATPAQLWVAERNPRARAFYHRNGFRPDGATFTDPDSGIEEIRLVR